MLSHDPPPPSTPPHPPPPTQIAHITQASLRLSRLNRSAVAQEASALTVLHDHLGLTPSILRALAEREEQLLTVTSLQEDLERKKQGVHVLEEDAKQVFGGDKGRTRKLQTLQNDIAALEAALVSGEAEYEKVKQRNKEVCICCVCFWGLDDLITDGGGSVVFFFFLSSMCVCL